MMKIRETIKHFFALTSATGLGGAEYNSTDFKD